MSLIEKAVKNPVPVIIIFALVSIAGLLSLQNVVLNLYPDIRRPVLTISTGYTNAGPESVEQSVTIPIEDAISMVSGIKKVSSVSSEGLSEVTVEFSEGTNLDTASAETAAKLEEAKRQLPPECTSPSISRSSASSSPILAIAVRGNRTVNEVNQLARDYVKDRLSQTAGVSKVEVWGGSPKIMRVELSQNRLDAYGLTLTEVSDALAAANIDLAGGRITENGRDYMVRTAGSYSDVGEIGNTVITMIQGIPVRVNDLGKAYLGSRDETACVYINGKPGVYILVYKQSDANTVTVADNVYRKMRDINASLPPGIKLEILEDSSLEIRSTITSLFSSLRLGLVLTIIILFLFLLNVRSTLIVGLSIPVSLVATMLAMKLFGLTLNMMTLTGLILAVGMIVDASIVVLENIMTYRSRGIGAREAAINGTREMTLSVVSGNLTTICVFVPLLFYRKQLGSMAVMFEDAAFTIVIALIASLFTAMFLVPVLAARLPQNSDDPGNAVRNGLYGSFCRSCESVWNASLGFYRRILLRALSHRPMTVAVSAAILVFTAALVPKLSILMMPDMSREVVSLGMTLPQGTSYETAKKEMLRWQDIAVREIKGADNIFLNIGDVHSMGTSYNTGSLDIYLPPAKKQIDTSKTVKEKFRRHFGEFDSMDFSFSTGDDSGLAPPLIDVAVHSANMKDAAAVAGKIQEIMSGIRGIAEPSVDMPGTIPQVEIAIDRERASMFGVTVNDAAREINACINGTVSSSFRRNGKKYDITVMYQPSDRKTIDDLNSIFVKGTGGRVCVANFADIVKSTGPESILRENQIRTVHVTGTVTANTNAGVYEKKIADTLASSYRMPDGVTISNEGSWSIIKKQLAVFFVVIIIAVLLVYGVMAATYGSFKAPLINLLTIPFLSTGIIIIYAVTGKPVTMISAVGVILLAGIVVNNGIILVDCISSLTAGGMKVNDACCEAGVRRLRPVLMTTLTTIFGTIPMVFDTSGAAALIQPIGLCIVGGLTSSTAVTLVLVPVVYSLIMEKRSDIR